MNYQSVKLANGGYMVTTFSADRAIRLCDGFRAGETGAYKVFKDTDKAFVGVLDIDSDATAIIKVPRSRSRRRWERFLTLFRQGESLRKFRQHLKLAELGVNGPQPFMAVEWRKQGVVVDGFYLYEFIDGRPGEQGDRDLIAKELLKLYRLGYRRKDPKPANFVIAGDRVYLIDFSLDRPLFFSRIRRAMELSQFSVNYNDYRRYARELGFSGLTIALGWRLQGFSQQLRRRRRNLSKSIRRR